MIQKSLKDRLKCLAGFLGFRYKVVPENSWGISPWQDIQHILGDPSFRVDKSPIKAIFDVGANEGQCATWLRNFYSDYDTQIYCFEPSEKAFRTLKKQSGDLAIRPFNLALSSNNEERVLYEYEGSVLNSLMPSTPVSNSSNATSQIFVKCVTLDDFCQEHKIEQIDILKIDTEGFDLEVLKGAESMLAKQKIRFVYFEFFNINKRFCDVSGNLTDISAFLQDFNYRPISFYTDFVNPLHPVSHFNALLCLWNP